MTKLLALLFIFLSMFGTSVMTMTLGWGVQPANWGWIVTGWFLTIVLAGLSNSVAGK
mgnify:CR=1 FL=1